MVLNRGGCYDGNYRTGVGVFSYALAGIVEIGLWIGFRWTIQFYKEEDRRTYLRLDCFISISIGIVNILKMLVDSE